MLLELIRDNARPLAYAAILAPLAYAAFRLYVLASALLPTVGGGQ